VQEGLLVPAVNSHRRPVHHKTKTGPRTGRKIKTGFTFGVLAILLALGVFTAPGASAATSTRVTLGPAVTTIRPGASAFLSGRVLAPYDGLGYVNVQLQFSRGQGWIGGGTVRTWSDGTAGFTVRPGSSVVFRLVFAGSATHAPSASVTVKVTVYDPGPAVVATAASLAGKPYQYGAAGPNSFDCSGYTQYVYRRYGRSLPHSATSQAQYGTAVSQSAARPGDLILIGSGSSYSHAGIYAGSGYMWDAATTGTPVGKHRIWSPAYVVRRLV
jgi:cell wall-associated NlpC family hydrolase